MTSLVLQAAIRFTGQDFRRVSVNGKFNAIHYAVLAPTNATGVGGGGEDDYVCTLVTRDKNRTIANLVAFRDPLSTSCVSQLCRHLMILV